MEPSTQETKVSKEAAARASLDAARALLNTPGMATAEIAHLLCRAERALGDAPDAALAALEASVPGTPPTRAERRALVQHVRRLRQRLGARAGRRVGARLVWGTLAGLVLGGLTWAGVAAGSASRGWRASYFPGARFAGEPVVQRDLEIAFRWGKGAPMGDFPKDGFSVRWESCLLLDAPQTLTFRVGSDDGARLYLDGEVILDGWWDHAFRWDEVERRVEPGVHRLKLEYYEDVGDAGVIFEAHRQGPEGPRLPASALRVPGPSGC